MFKNICLPHVFNRNDAQLRQTCEHYYSVPKSETKKRSEAKRALEISMKLFFESVEMLGQYNYDRTRELLQWIRDNPDYPQRLREMIRKNGVNPNCRQLGINYIRFSGEEVYREKWQLLGREVFKLSNVRKTKAAYGAGAGYYECCIRFVESDDFERFMDDHKEFLRRPGEEETKKRAEEFSNELLVMAGADCTGCEHQGEENVFNRLRLYKQA
jgi:hypothetical protein